MPPARRIKAERKGRGGFSLIELMIALALSAVVMAGAGTMLLQAYANEAAYREQNEAQRNARVALDTVTEDLREARKSVGWPREVPPYYPSLDVSLTQLRLQTWDNSTEPITIRYWLEEVGDGTMLLRREVRDSGNRVTRLSVVARNLRRPEGGPPFASSRDAQGNLRSPFWATRIYKEGLPALDRNVIGTTVTVTATVGDDPNDPNDSYSTVTMRSDVTMRNYLF